MSKNKKIKVAVIGTAGVPARYGGFETLAHQLVLKLNRKYDLDVYCSNKYYAINDRKKVWHNCNLHYLPFNANGAQSIPYDVISMIYSIFRSDVLLVLGVSGGILFPFIKLFTKKKIIVNIDGLEWKRNKWNFWIKKFLKFSEYLSVKYSDAEITDNAAIQKYTSLHYKSLSCLIEYGADHATRVPITDFDKNQYPFLNGLYAFSVCRIEPENNIHLILSAFSELPERKLVIVGNWDNSKYGVLLRQKYDEFENITLIDPIYEQRNLDILRSNCYVYMHGHSAGGTNPSLVEAMYLGLPVVAYDVSYNRATTEDRAFYFSDVESLKKIVEKNEVSHYKGNRLIMKIVADERYTWDVIAEKYGKLIDEISSDEAVSAELEEL